MLMRQGSVAVWHDPADLLPGRPISMTTQRRVWTARTSFCCWVSPDLSLHLDYATRSRRDGRWNAHREGTARLISVILRPCDWTFTELAQFLVTPRDGKPITQWPDRDEAFLDVARSIRRAIEEIGGAGEPKQIHDFIEGPAAQVDSAERPRSSNLRLRKDSQRPTKIAFFWRRLSM